MPPDTGLEEKDSAAFLMLEVNMTILPSPPSLSVSTSSPSTRAVLLPPLPGKRRHAAAAALVRVVVVAMAVGDGRRRRIVYVAALVTYVGSVASIR